MWKTSLVFIFIIILTQKELSCGLIPSLACDVKMTKEYIESSCGLTNGVRFEELKVLTHDSNNSPQVYSVVSSFQCYNPGVETGQKFWPDKLYFNKANGHYLWNSDTSTNGIYIRKGPWRDKIETEETALDSVIKTKMSERQKNRSDYTQATGKANIQPGLYSQSVCPATFKPNTWYFLNFYDQRYEAYLFVDKDMNFIINKIELPTNF